MNWMKKHAVGISLTVACFVRHGLEYLYAFCLQHTRKDRWFLTEDVLRHIRSCANAAYPSTDFFCYNDCETVADLLQLCGCAGIGQIYALTGKSWYMLLIRHPFYFAIHDFASASGVCADFSLYGRVRTICARKKCGMVCRDKTSYPLVLLLKRFRRIEVLQDEAFVKNGEHCHKVWFRFVSASTAKAPLK